MIRAVIFDCEARSQVKNDRPYSGLYMELEFQMSGYIIREDGYINRINFTYQERGVDQDQMVDDIISQVFSGKFINKEYIHVQKGSITLPTHLLKYDQPYVYGLFFHMENFPDWFKEKFNARIQTKKLEDLCL